MKILPFTISKLDVKNIDKLSCVVSPEEIIKEPEGNLYFYMGDTPLATCPLLSELRHVEFLTPSSGIVWVKNTYPFAITIDNIEINKDTDTINSYTVDMYARLKERIHSEICFVFLVTNNHIGILEELALKSLYNYGCYPDIPLIIAGFSLTPKIKERLSRYNCKIIDFYEHETFFAAGHKMSLWMLPRIVHSNYFAIMDCDLLIGSDLNGFFDTLHQYPDDKLFCGSWNFSMKDYYSFHVQDRIEYIQNTHHVSDSIFSSPGYINAGFYVMPRMCALNIDSLTQTYNDSISKTKDFYYTEELVLNTCTKRLNNRIIMSEGYNYAIQDTDTLDINEDCIIHNNKRRHVIHLLGNKLNHVQKVKQKTNWKLNIENIYQG